MKYRKLVLGAMLAALSCTTAVLFPIPSGAGYIFLTDGFVLLAGWLLGAKYGAASAGIGAVLSDIFTPNVVYAPASFVIKTVMVLIVCCFKSKLLGGILAEIWMVLGYFLYAWLCLFGNIVMPLTSALGNTAQGAAGLLIGLMLYRSFQNSKLSKEENA